jgi:hypothetical protein
LLQNLTLERIKELLIIIPAAHIFLCFVYLFFYYSSFGYGIWLYSSPTDVFSVSFSRVAPGYLWLFAGMLVGHFVFSPTVTSVSSGELPGVPLYFKFALWSAVAGAIVFVVLAVIIWLRTGFLFFQLLTNPMALLVGYSWASWGRKLTSNLVTLNLSLALPMAIISIALAGLGDGQMDRSGRISEVGANRPTCNDLTVLRALSSNFLAVARDNSRVIIDQNCKVKFTLFPAAKFIPRPDGAPMDIAFNLRPTSR